MNAIYNYFKEINELNTIIRSGWLRRNVKAKRLESVSEHIFSTSLLALAIIDKYHISFLNVEKVLKMILIHELGEIDAGDITIHDIELLKTKYDNEYKGINRICNILGETWMLELWQEMEKQETKEAKFVFKMDKLQGVMQAKYYSEILNRPDLFEDFHASCYEQCGEFIEVSE